MKTLLQKNSFKILIRHENEITHNHIRAHDYVQLHSHSTTKLQFYG